MKKIFKILFVLLSFVSVKNVFAQDQYKLTLYKPGDVYYYRKSDNVNESLKYYIYKFGNMYAYCIEPGVDIKTYNYLGYDDFVDLPFSEELKEKLELIGYYGREYPNHDTDYYSMATQALIWENISNTYVTFWTEPFGKGKEIDVSKEKEVIMNLVNNHKVLPSISTNLYGDVKKEIIIDDKNNVLENYEVISNNIGNVQIEGNKLHLLFETPGIYNLKLRKKDFNEYKTIIFVGKDNPTTQKYGRMHFSKNVEMNITVNISGVKLLIHKVDENNNPLLIENISFKVKDVKTGEYLCNLPGCEYKTNKNGIIVTESLPFGEYEIEEVENQIIPGYIWNKEKLHVLIDNNSDIKWNDEYHNYVDLSFYNKKVLGDVKLKKYGEEFFIKDNDIYYQKIVLPSIKLSLYDDKDNYINSFITNSDGIIEYNNLSIGKYYFVEDTQNVNYIENNQKYFFEITQNNQYDNIIHADLEIDNYLKKGTLEFSKEDLVTTEGIADTIIEIYDEKDNLLLTEKTDNNGKVIINNLPIGKYYIVEKEANKNYLISNEKVFFEIKDDKEIVKAKMTNEKIKGILEIYKEGEEYYIDSNNIVYQQKELGNIEFNVYDENDNLVSKIKTDENGYAKIDDLSLGNYYLKENNNDIKYVKDDNRYNFSIKQNARDDNNIIVKIYLKNYLKKGTLEFSKEDLVTTEGIADTIIEIYDEKDNLLLTEKTDNNGKVIINNLPIGKYYIVEKEANKNYLISNEKVFFEIKDDKEIVKAKMTNEKISVPVPKTGMNNNMLFDLLTVFVLLSMVFYYDKNWIY